MTGIVLKAVGVDVHIYERSPRVLDDRGAGIVLIPGAEGETERGKRRINWVWYWNVPEAELPELITGVDAGSRISLSRRVRYAMNG
jgi:hypothetical protein